MDGSDGEMRLVCGGKVLQDHLNLSAQGRKRQGVLGLMVLGVTGGAKIYVAVKKMTNAMPSKPIKPTNSGKSESDPLIGPLLKVRIF